MGALPVVASPIMAGSPPYSLRVPADHQGRRAAGLRVHHLRRGHRVGCVRGVPPTAGTGWQVPAYTFPEHREDLAVLRVVCRNGFSLDLADLFFNDLLAAVDNLKQEAGDFHAERPRRLPPLITDTGEGPGQRMLIARAMTRAARARDTIDSTTIISLAQTRTADTSVGLNARAVLNDRTR